MSGIRSCVTISLVDYSYGGPFVFWEDFAAGCAHASNIGFDAVELFAPGPDAISAEDIRAQLDLCNLSLAAVGTGAGKLLHGFSLSDSDDSKRAEACDYARSMIDYGAELNAPAIVGSMQGNADSAGDVHAARARLAESLESLGNYAESKSVPLMFEPINRYESNLSNTLQDAMALIGSQSSKNIKILADLFHMNIEEPDMAKAIQYAGSHIGHVHFADSNRRAVGFGHTDIQPVADALKKIRFNGYLSAEVFPDGDCISAAKQTKASFDKYFG